MSCCQFLSVPPWATCGRHRCLDPRCWVSRCRCDAVPRSSTQAREIGQGKHRVSSPFLALGSTLRPTAVADVFQRVTEQLAARYTMVTYDRRGSSRSQLDGPQDYDHRLDTDADDVRRLIEHVGDEPAAVVGFSSGAIVALTVLTHYPSVVHTLVPFEPPAVRQLPDGQQWLEFFFRVYDLYRQSGIGPAVEEFRERAFAQSDRQAMARAREARHGEYALANAAYWFEHELRQYPAVALDLDLIRAHAERIVLAAGQESRGYPCYRVNAELGKKIRREVIELPGGHIGCVTQPAAFARELVRARARAGHGPKT